MVKTSLTWAERIEKAKVKIRVPAKEPILQAHQRSSSKIQEMDNRDKREPG